MKEAWCFGSCSYTCAVISPVSQNPKYENGIDHLHACLWGSIGVVETRSGDLFARCLTDVETSSRKVAHVCAVSNLSRRTPDVKTVWILSTHASGEVLVRSKLDPEICCQMPDGCGNPVQEGCPAEGNGCGVCNRLGDLGSVCWFQRSRRKEFERRRFGPFVPCQVDPENGSGDAVGSAARASNRNKVDIENIHLDLVCSQPKTHLVTIGIPGEPSPPRWFKP